MSIKVKNNKKNKYTNEKKKMLLGKEVTVVRFVVASTMALIPHVYASF